jgi:signal transduction histidine kinase
VTGRHPGRRRALLDGLGVRLFASYLAVGLVGVATLLLATRLTAPTFFAQHMAHMPAGGAGGVVRPDGGAGMAGMPGMMSPPGPRGAAMDDALAAAFRAAVDQALVLAAAAAAVVALGVSLGVAGRVVRPVRRLAAASGRLAAGHYGERVAVETPDELGELAVSFNELAGALEATERRRSELIGDVAHELRTPVATLEGYLEGLLDGVVESSPATWARLHGEAGRLRRLVDDLQELSRAEAGQIPLRLTAADPAAIVRSAVARLEAQFAEKGLALAVDAPAGLPPVRADPDRTVQVLTNLLTNALRYTPDPGRVRITARPAGGAAGAAAPAVEFAVADSGIGVAPEHLPHLFERFYRADKSRSRAVGGSGVGLTVARALVQAMGGRIRAESAGPGRGSTFAFTLPTARDVPGTPAGPAAGLTDS